MQVMPSLAPLSSVFGRPISSAACSSPLADAGEQEDRQAHGGTAWTSASPTAQTAYLLLLRILRTGTQTSSGSTILFSSLPASRFKGVMESFSRMDALTDPGNATPEPQKIAGFQRLNLPKTL